MDVRTEGVGKEIEKITCAFLLVLQKENMSIQACIDRKKVKEYCGKFKTRMEGPWRFGEQP